MAAPTSAKDLNEIEVMIAMTAVVAAAHIDCGGKIPPKVEARIEALAQTYLRANGRVRGRDATRPRARRGCEVLRRHCRWLGEDRQRTGREVKPMPTASIQTTSNPSHEACCWCSRGGRPDLVLVAIPRLPRVAVGEGRPLFKGR
jgi:hypothetical protein